MKNISKIVLTVIVSLLMTAPALAQGTASLDQTMRSSGRIYVVVAVMLTILAGLIIYLVRLDRRITRLEKD